MALEDEMRTTITLDDETAKAARALGINISAAGRRGVEEEVRRQKALSDRRAYERFPEADDDWSDAEAWS